MGRKKKAADLPAETYLHADATRKNNPTAGLAAEGNVKPMPNANYSYSPRLPPQLRFDPTGAADRLPELLEKATREPLTPEEARLLADALHKNEPWLEWAGKRERPGFAVDPVAVHIHERVSTQAILAAAARKDVERSLFADPAQELREALRFYEHDVDWANRLILGDSLLVMSSLARREDLAGKVQMIYIDPPYGIKFASNFQPEIGKREVKDKDTDLTREPEMVKAFRDTWHLGVHSYLNYLRDRLSVARELLSESGSLFVQIGDENLHRVRIVIEEIFGSDNFVSVITFQKAAGTTSELISSPADYIIWYAKNRKKAKFHPIYSDKQIGGLGGAKYTGIELLNGQRITLNAVEDEEERLKGRVYRLAPTVSQGFRANTSVPFEFRGKVYDTGKSLNWKTTIEGMRRLVNAERIEPSSNSLNYIRYMDDFPSMMLTSIWTDIRGIQSRDDPKVYVVQTATPAIQRCVLMTTDPGDLVLDPTCGSGTTAYVAEQWGRRWITIDTSRVAVAIARQRLLTAKFDFYRLCDEPAGPAGGFRYKTVPHVTLKSIAQNTDLDPIFARHEPILNQALAKCSAALAAVTDEVRRRLEVRLIDRQRRDGKRAVTDADRRRWQLPDRGEGWQHWTVPFDNDPDWPKELQQAVAAYRKAWRAKMDELNDCIAKNAESEPLVDQPEVDKGVVRVSGPFTVEGVQPPEVSLGGVIDHVGGFGGEPEEVGPTFEMREARLGDSPENIEAYLDRMVRLLRTDGVRFPDNKQMRFSRLEALYASGQGGGFHAEGRWAPNGDRDPDPEGPATVGVVFGPQFGPVTLKMVEDLIKPARRRFDDFVIAGFSFTAEAQSLIDEFQHDKLRLHIAHIRPDVNPGMDGLLKEQPGGQLFTVFGQPRTRAFQTELGEWVVVMEGVDIYDPVDNSLTPTRADKVAAWFLDTDYDEKGAFCVSQAFFPDPSSWEKLSKALSGVVDPSAFAHYSSTESLPFKRGQHGKAAVRVIDPRGNEVMRVHPLRAD